ncbi:hypothetical protein PoB_004119400 [Plakobranchus ocellatus]|uniref:Uncharacterized protein n=1 Tax=Plakobranchus ocellatus TaxID=259542 RepID=A0AAV4B3Q6_9GAST|nr:hypothetical protein PoB_004119400 [Plakobranchus ocellatus]
MVAKLTFHERTYKIGGAVAHLVGQLATNSKVQGSNPSPGQINLLLLLQDHPALNGLLRPSENKGDEESNGKLPHNATYGFILIYMTEENYGSKINKAHPIHDSSAFDAGHEECEKARHDTKKNH